MLPSRRKEFDIFDEMFNDPFFHHGPRMPRKEEMLMRTDVKEKESNYEIAVDLPGYNKEDIKVAVENGYLTISASKQENNEEKEEGNFVRRERFVGECSRSFYVGDNIKTEDIKANFKNGTLRLDVPKKEEKEIPETKYVEIED